MKKQTALTPRAIALYVFLMLITLMFTCWGLQIVLQLWQMAGS